ncbi:translocase [Pseudooceanicola nanhaiensis]|uniref:preprotein translocase subunit SecA n=1 Tax=Pseudooceanicola nanhaiensis TaxID=375761 RepID=UPI001CD489F6|nr:translocase [Pseudooceanicola nanhaiensis]MCA0921683.1 translocase [Pseudooceanicola nanhaiensis]
MSDAALSPPVLKAPVLSPPARSLRSDAWYGFEAPPARQGRADLAVARAQALLLARWTGLRGQGTRRILQAVALATPGLDRLDDAALAARARQLGQAAARGDPAALRHAGPLFACVREAAGRALGKRHYPAQMRGAWAMMRGQLAEMQTGEGKTLTGTLTAAAMALTGRPVHVVTVNDYLATRDAEEMRPVYDLLGLSVGLVTAGMSPEARRAAYGADVTYCTNKELAFDFLKDRIDPAVGSGRLQRRVRSWLAGPGGGLQRGLAFCIIDEADSVLIDEARTPLILSGEGPALHDVSLLRTAEALMQRLEPRDYTIDLAERRIELTDRGLARLDGPLRQEGLLSNRRLREELVTKALTARHLFRRDEHYLVREGAIEIIDENTGRTMPDRFWEEGLHQLIELKEGLDPSRGRVTLARTTYQRFFRRYDRISGMSGTLDEVAGELWRVYGVAVARIPTHRPVQRRMERPVILRDSTRRWLRVAEEAEALQGQGLPVLIGTRTVAASRALSQVLTRRGVAHVVLSADQDAEEARTIAEAGQPGRITVATNMAGRGADIALQGAARARGGLQVLMSEAHESARIDRQLAGRAGRQGDPGRFRPLLSLDDALLAQFPTLWAHPRLLALPGLGPRLAARGFARAQARAGRMHRRMRADLLRQDEVLNDAMSYAGVPD